MEGQAFLTTVAGLSVSLAGFGSVIAWLRDDPTAWNPISLWRLKTIVRHGLTLAFLCLALNPVFTLSGSEAATVRVGSLLVAAFSISDVWRVRSRDPVVWQPRETWLIFVNGNSLIAVLAVVNVALLSFGLLQSMVLVLLSSPASIFFSFVREMGGSEGSLASEGGVAERGEKL